MVPGHEVYNEEIVVYEPPVVKRTPTEDVFPTALHVDAAHNPLSDSVVDKLARQLVVDATSPPCAS